MPQGAGYGSQKDRAQTSIGGGGNGRSAGPGGSIAAAKANQQPQTTDYGAPIHTATGPVYGGIQVAKSPQAWGALNDQVNTYNDAARKWNAGAGPSLANTVNAFAPFGLSMQAPEYNKPKTYVGGDYHLGLNPAQLAGGLLGGLAFPGAGTVIGPLAGKLYSEAGLPNVMLGGGKVPDSWAINSAGNPSPVAAGASPQQLGNPTQGGPMAAFGGTQATAAGGAPFGPQPTQTGTATPPAYGNGRLPNHSLPYGYQSLFPNSLSDEDKALLYAKALSA